MMSSRRVLTLLAILLVTLFAFGLAAQPGSVAIAGDSAAGGYQGAPDLDAGLIEVAHGQGGTRRPPLEKNLTLVSFLQTSAPGETSDVWAHRNFAYVGGFGPDTTVKVVDISDPAAPAIVAALSAPAGCSPQDVKVADINTGQFSGDLLVVANDGCADAPNGGVQLYDVTDPTNPVLLSAPRIGPVHNAYLYQRGNHAYVLLAIPFAEVFSGITPPFIHIGDFVVLDVTDPTNPEMIADWGAGKDGGLAYGAPFLAGIPGVPPGSDCTPPPGTDPVCRGAFPAALVHDVWANQNGTVAYLSYWDLGLVLLDISDPANPTLIGVGPEPATFGNDEGNGHVAVPAQGGNLVLVGDEDFAPGPWGFLRVFDSSDATDPFQIGAFATPGSLGSDPLPATMHNIIVRGSRAYLSWYFEGLRVVDISQPSDPREIAAFVADPTQTTPGLFWGIYAQGDLIFGSDILGGLFILRQEAAGHE